MLDFVRALLKAPADQPTSVRGCRGCVRRAQPGDGDQLSRRPKLHADAPLLSVASDDLGIGSTL